MKSCNHKHLAAPTQLSLKGLKQQQYNLLVNFCCYIYIKYILGCIIIDLASGADYNAHYSSSQYGFCSCIHLRLCLFIFFFLLITDVQDVTHYAPATASPIPLPALHDVYYMYKSLLSGEDCRHASLAT